MEHAAPIEIEIVVFRHIGKYIHVLKGLVRIVKWVLYIQVMIVTLILMVVNQV